MVMTRLVSIASALVLSFAACSDDSGTSGAGASTQGGSAEGGSAQGGGVPSTYAVHVDVRGLVSGGLQLTLDSGESLTVDADGIHTFSASLDNGDSYAVTAVGPRGEACAVSMGSGSIDGADATASVDCEPVVVSVFEQAPNWNDYVNAAGTAACDTASAGGTTPAFMVVSA